MVTLAQVYASNDRIATELDSGLVAVFVGGTNGVGEATVKRFAKRTVQPRVYIIGRSTEAGNRIVQECQVLNKEGAYTFIQADTSLLRNVDIVCEQIKSKEKVINLLFLTTGTLIFDQKTSEGINLSTALAIYSRVKFIVNLLPLLERATSLRRVVTVFTATKEGPIDVKDIEGVNVPFTAMRGHGSSIATISLESLQETHAQALEAAAATTTTTNSTTATTTPLGPISYIHSFPGPVKSGIARGTTGIIMGIVKVVFALLGPFINMDLEECGERHLYLATSARYPPNSSSTTTTTTSSSQNGSGVTIAKGGEEEVKVAQGTTGEIASGVYSVDSRGDSAGPKVINLLKGFRTDGTVEKVWQHVQGEFERISLLK